MGGESYVNHERLFVLPDCCSFVEKPMSPEIQSSLVPRLHGKREASLSSMGEEKRLSPPT